MKSILFLTSLFGFVVISNSLPSYKLQHKQLQYNLFHGTNNDISKSCSICKTAVSFLQGFWTFPFGEDILSKLSEFVCEKFHLSSPRICHAIIPEFKHMVWKVFFDGSVDPNIICGQMFGESCVGSHSFFSSWNITLSQPLSKDNDDDIQVNDIQQVNGIQEEDAFQVTDNPLRIVQLTDTHIDREYLAGSLAECDEPLCCRKNNRKAGNNETAAPKFGYAGYCDTNILMFHTLLQGIQDNHKDVKYVYWTGDIPAHDVWNQNKNTQIDAISYATATLKEYLPDKRIFPTLGNHEGYPVDSFPHPSMTGEDSDIWLRSTLAEKWGTWLPKDTEETILRGGFYTTMVEGNLRLISLNMNYGNPSNWWLWIKSEDPAGQLQWFADTLAKAEEAGEKVHVIGHLPPCHTLKWFSYNYYRIINRFYKTITGQFFGHTHHDEFRLFYDMETFTKPISIAYVAPSVTTYHELNPGYRIYSIDGQQGNKTWHVVDHDTYYADLVEANKIDKLEFQHEYNARKAYELKTMSPANWNRLLYRFLEDDELFQLFYKSYYKQKKNGICVGKCKQDYLCTMASGMAKGLYNFCKFDNVQETHDHLTWRSKTYNKC